ncbi:ATP-binding protein [Streptomyces venezuelae]|uniref:ATP-binding protein n=1 Tax=Streptomyces venezuelae TaxID=54571 RepID=UPI0012385B4C|nr:ATP-binding protein [Streptomyces venezuelae]
MLKIRNLQLRVVTEGPLCGADLQFVSGLNVLRADNSSGKSTCMQAVIYALGLEGMLSARRDIPLPHAMTDSIEVDGRDFSVLESWVALEVENSSGHVITVRRHVKSATKHMTLVEEFTGPCLSEGLPMERGTDYFVRRPGAAIRDRGFHHRLAAFLGWELPQVSRLDGSEGPLYLECLFPYFFVEQKHGWSGIQARIPTHFMIRDVSRRAAEFILNLDEYSAVLRRQRLESAGSQMDSEWRQVVDRLVGTTKGAAVVLRGVPQRPVLDAAAVAIEAVIASDSKWITIDDEITLLQARLDELDGVEVPTVEESSQQLDFELSRAQEQLTVIAAKLRDEIESLTESSARRDGLEFRVEALEEDLQRHKDAALLRRLGSDHAAVIGGESTCPTCQQALPDGFDVTLNPMSPDESITYIEQELRTFRAMHTDMQRVIENQQAKVAGLRDRMSQVRRGIRAVKQSLTSPSSTPSVATVAERIRLQDRIEALRSVQAEILTASNDLRTRAVAWSHNRGALRALAEQGQSPQDAAKIAFLQNSLRQQLRSYHFNSLDAESIEISPDTYRPIHEGFDLGFDLSASDMIRVIWAYLLAFLEAGLNFSTNHARLLIFDEPRQQETNRLSFSALLGRAANVNGSEAQIIFATSEEAEALAGMLQGRPHHLISSASGAKLIKPIQ